MLASPLERLVGGCRFREIVLFCGLGHAACGIQWFTGSQDRRAQYLTSFDTLAQSERVSKKRSGVNDMYEAPFDEDRLQLLRETPSWCLRGIQPLRLVQVDMTQYFTRTLAAARMIDDAERTAEIIRAASLSKAPLPQGVS